MQRRQWMAGLLCAVAPRAATARDLTINASDRVTRWAGERGFSGVVAIGREGKVIEAHAFGLASVEGEIPATLTTQYAIGSVSKWLTTLAVLRLCDRGQMTLDAPLAAYLPSLRGPARDEVRLADLLCNASGIPDRLAQAARTDPSIRTSTSSALAMVERYVEGDLAFTPSTRFDYTVLNWVIVRAILEAVTARSFGELMFDLVLRPAGVTGIGISERGFSEVPGLAVAYRSIDPPVRKLDPVPAFAAASGSFFADAASLLWLMHQCFASPLLSQASRKALLQVRIPAESYAIGGRVRTVEGQVWAWETGKIGGYRSHAAHNVARSRAIVVLSNDDRSQQEIEGLVEQLARVV